jgi:hypothetical protein
VDALLCAAAWAEIFSNHHRLLADLPNIMSHDINMTSTNKNIMY